MQCSLDPFTLDQWGKELRGSLSLNALKSYNDTFSDEIFIHGI